MKTRIALAFSALLIASIFPGVAAACNNSGNASVDQYVETISTGGCSSGAGTGTGTGKETKAPLPKKAVQALNTMTDQKTASILKTVATSSKYGAPQKRMSTKGVAKTKHSPSFISSFGEALSSPGSGSETRLIGLLVTLFAITGVAAVAAALKQRNQRNI